MEARSMLKPVSLMCLLALSVFFVGDAGAEKTRTRFAIGPTLTIDNGVTGDGRLEVTLGAGGEDDLLFDPIEGFAPTNLLFELNHYVDVGIDGGGVQLGATTITQPPTLTGPNEVTSAGSFTGPNGTIAWTAVSTIPSGSVTYTTTLTFTSAAPFGAVRLIQYMDADVDNFSADNLIHVGTFGLPDFRLLTVSTVRHLGPAQLSPIVSNASCPGWAASRFPTLVAAIDGGGTSYAPEGNVIDLVPIVDPRFNGLPAWGPADMTSAIACDLGAGATTATITFAVAVEERAGIPTLSQWAVITMVALLVILGARQLHRRRLTPAA
jgi:hypothetical protein